MSITISATSYFINPQQSTRTSGEEKQTSKAGKTQYSAVSASLDQVNMGQEGIAIAEVSRQQGTEQSHRNSPLSPNMDTVEISAEGRAASTKLQKQSAAAAEQYELEDLSQYTDTELKQMYYKGEITRQEYEGETGILLE